MGFQMEPLELRIVRSVEEVKLNESEVEESMAPCTAAILIPPQRKPVGVIQHDIYGVEYLS